MRIPNYFKPHCLALSYVIVILINKKTDDQELDAHSLAQYLIRNTYIFPIKYHNIVHAMQKCMVLVSQQRNMKIFTRLTFERNNYYRPLFDLT